jgi:hypothetical protein
VIDWAAVEPVYRAGLRSLANIGEEFGCSPPAILKHAKRHGWERSLKKRIAEAAEAKVNAALVHEPVSAVNDDAVVSANASAVAEVRLRHRKDALRLQTTVDRLTGELEGMDPDTDNLQMRVRIAKDLIDAKARLIAIEREAFCIGQVVEERPEETIDLMETARRVAYVLQSASKEMH